jgi:hypothetical protein
MLRSVYGYGVGIVFHQVPPGSQSVLRIIVRLVLNVGDSGLLNALVERGARGLVKDGYNAYGGRYGFS